MLFISMRKSHKEGIEIIIESIAAILIDITCIDYFGNEHYFHKS